MATPPRARAWLPFLAAAVPFALLAWRFDWLCDDAYISFRYAKHLAEGHGLRFNLGDSPPVEGYSNFLWVVWLSLFERLGLDVTVAARASSAACGLLLVSLVVRHVSARVVERPSSAVGAALFLGTLPPLAVWATGGLATMPFTLALFVVWERLLGDAGRPRGLQAGAAAAIAVLLRADGLGWVVLVCVSALVSARRGRNVARWRSAMIALALAAATFGLHALWRHATYGAWVPNTAQVKVGLAEMARDPEVRDMILLRGRNYLVSFLLTFPAIGLVLAATPALALAGRRAGAGRPRVPAGCALPIAGGAAYAWLVGGDFMTMGRFLVPALPLVVVLFAWCLDRVAASGRKGEALAWTATAACVAVSLLPTFDRYATPRAWREAFHFRWNEKDHVKTEWGMWRFMRDNATKWSYLGRALQLHTEPGESITLGPIGAVGYYSGLYVYDSYGLTNAEVAHAETSRLPKSPGHDKEVPTRFFDAYRPTYAGALLLGRDDELPPSDFFGDKELERIPLDAAGGFPPGTDLILVRYRWHRAP